MKALGLGMLLNSGLAAHCSKVNTGEISAGRNRKIALIRRLATWGEDRLMSQNQLQRFCSAMNVFKGKKGEAISVNH